MALSKQEVAFLKEMLGHHKAALVMSNKVLKNAKNKFVISLAKGIIKTQTAEIAQMKDALEKDGESSAPAAGGHDGGHMNKTVWNGTFSL